MGVLEIERLLLAEVEVKTPSQMPGTPRRLYFSAVHRGYLRAASQRVGPSPTARESGRLGSCGERALAREVALHLTMLEEDYRRRGLSPAEAHRQARLALGGEDQTQEWSRDARTERMAQTLVGLSFAKTSRQWRGASVEAQYGPRTAIVRAFHDRVFRQVGHRTVPEAASVDSPADLHATATFEYRLKRCRFKQPGRATAMKLLADGRADFVSFGKLFLANPGLPLRFAVVRRSTYRIRARSAAATFADISTIPFWKRPPCAAATRSGGRRACVRVLCCLAKHALSVSTYACRLPRVHRGLCLTVLPSRNGDDHTEEKDEEWDHRRLNTKW